MIEVSPNLFVGTEADCFLNEKPGWAVVHACKTPCHQRIIGYRGSLAQNHPLYLVYEKNTHLYLNIIDPPLPLFKLELFSKSIDFINRQISNCRVLVHCNNGRSRAPSIALLYLAKREQKISNKSFLEALTDFKKLYPAYQPGTGIYVYLQQNWESLK